ncbi:hypothetical protein GEV33_006936 [Tenebrio molitor]|uniref:Gustatory receptor n=1 Tax=Tenebrio molitor TaxID=7067 RepID=A0A8J6LCU0_TENMO|nr:hypothetical protein GEV33_006936 [Tenebrio molitor]
MDLGAIKTIFSFGSLLALTPPKIENVTTSMPRKLYIMAMKSHYSRLALIPSVLRILLEVDLLTYGFYTVIVVGLMKRKQWSLLIRNLERVECEVNNKISLYWIFFVSNAIYFAMNVYTFYVWIDVIGVKFIKGYCVESLQVYSQFFNTVLACVILKMIQSRYKYQKFLLNRHLTLARKQLSNLILLKVKRNLLVLKETVDHFNDIFGWAILLNIFFASLRGLIYLDDTIKGVDNIKNVSRNYWQIASQIFLVLIFWIGIFALILWCDTIRKEFEELLSYCYQMQTRIAESSFTENDMCIFTKSVSQSMPEFTAARKSVYSRLTLIPAVLRILLEVDLLIYGFYTVIVVGLMKRKQWSLLIRNLERVECEVNNQRSLYWIFFASNAIYFAMNIYTLYVWIDVVGVKFIQGFCVESLQVYSQFFNTVLACVILKMIQSRYKYQKFLLNQHLTLARKQLSNLILLKVKRNLLVLKETVDHFNDIFGWAILLNIFFGSLRGLIYLDDAIKGVDSIKNVSKNYWQTASQFFFVLLFWIGIFALILWCDIIRKEFEELLSYCYQMQTCIAESTFTENDMCIFTKSVSQSMPEFTAARYFSIDRSTIFSILNSITTFLLVMIQFKSL